ncbi:MAG: transcription termination factor NusA [Desulfovibrio sp.]|nr:transcription termination factor NusA [Desulfovibrio sp.]
MNLELKKAIDQISKDKGLDRDMLVTTLEEAVRTSVQRRFNDNIDVEVNYNEETGDIEVYQFKVVMEDGDVANDDTQIELSEARLHDPSVQIDDEVGFRVRVEDLGRIAAQSAKQVIIQRMRDAEHEIIYNEYKDRIGEIVSGNVQRRDRGGWVVNLGRTEAILPREEQIPREHFKRGDRVQALIIKVCTEGRGPQVVISRAHRDYMAALFRREVPEVDDGVVQIMGVARDPGSRAKVAVFSREREVDPVGACVGVRGSRIQNVVQELHNERIDIVVWSPDMATYARNALAPAIVTRIIVDEESKLLEVIVPDDQLTNAIGRKGQNVKLAARLLGWKVDIFTESRYNEVNAIGHGLEQVASVAEISLETMLAAGYTSLDKLRAASDQELADALTISANRIADLRAAVNFLAPVVEKEQESSAVNTLKPAGAEAEADAENAVESEAAVDNEDGEAAAEAEEAVPTEDAVDDEDDAMGEMGRQQAGGTHVDD